LSRIGCLEELYSELDSLLDIYETCQECETCCNACIFLLSEEADELVRSGVQVVEINGKLNCIDSFPKNEDGEIVRVRKTPLCGHSSNNICSIHEKRPLFCRLYPMGFRYGRKYAHVVLSKNCRYVKKMKKKQLQARIAEMRQMIDRIDPNLLTHVLSTFHEVAKIQKRYSITGVYNLRSFELKNIP
jgi:Fe-S-cluster containining protein